MQSQSRTDNSRTNEDALMQARSSFYELLAAVTEHNTPSVPIEVQEPRGRDVVRRILFGRTAITPQGRPSLLRRILIGHTPETVNSVMGIPFQDTSPNRTDTAYIVPQEDGTFRIATAIEFPKRLQGYYQLQPVIVYLDSIIEYAAYEPYEKLTDKANYKLERLLPEGHPLRRAAAPQM